MFVKTYSYSIKPEREKDYLEIQVKAEQIYSRFTNKQTFYLQSKEDSSKWMEMHIYQDEKSYTDSIHAVDQQPEIKEMYKHFLEVITSEEELTEDSYNIRNLT
ncbi:hypothetical protein J7E38_13990 [Bacillus sp. ISL-35]|uniref:hypothetical protein n=1 Tax=Bacillus sp. ISL-35 TaxID=2819122 RepID=UPI001BE843F6|nr:hypothetical protein [Bacillus sp. ISL-35]MBT2680121.1 hypothetical protein [Bacillus sp. ISL-35]MBT2704395.1 hypothetical protein [Chryseobacterium sp. ISL-80]